MAVVKAQNVSAEHRYARHLSNVSKSYTSGSPDQVSFYTRQPSPLMFTSEYDTASSSSSNSLPRKIQMEQLLQIRSLWIEVEDTKCRIIPPVLEAGSTLIAIQRCLVLQEKYDKAKRMNRPEIVKRAKTMLADPNFRDIVIKTYRKDGFDRIDTWSKVFSANTGILLDTHHLHLLSCLFNLRFHLFNINQDGYLVQARQEQDKQICCSSAQYPDDIHLIQIEPGVLATDHTFSHRHYFIGLCLRPSPQQDSEIDSRWSFKAPTFASAVASPYS